MVCACDGVCARVIECAVHADRLLVAYYGCSYELVEPKRALQCRSNLRTLPACVAAPTAL